MFQYNSNKINIVEVGPRDGLQNEKAILSLEDKVEYIRLLSETGLNCIEATSFVRKDRIPQMADAKKLFETVKSFDNFEQISYPCLVPNMIGYENAKTAGVQEISLFSATSDSFTKKNINCTVDESFERMKLVAEQANKDSKKIRGYISTAFGCPYDGVMSKEALIKVAKNFIDLGVYEISIGDTIGVATPKQVHEYLSALTKEIPLDKIALHFHDTRGMALANILTSLEVGIKVFDASSGGLGGCPYAKGATGNVATEDVHYLCESLGLKTGLDLEKLLNASKFILGKVNKESPSKYLQTLLKE